MADKVSADKLSTETGASPADLLKRAVTGARPAPVDRGGAMGGSRNTAARSRAWALPGAALGVGALIGALGMTLSSPRQDLSGEALAHVRSGVEAGRIETARLNGEIERIGRIVEAMRDSADAGRNDAKSRSAAIADRVAKAESTISAKLASVVERHEQMDREHVARLGAITAKLDKAMPIAAPAPAPQAAKTAPAEPIKTAPAEPMQTGSIADAKAKPVAIDGWAVREVYDGVAMLEDRKRRLVEIGPGDTVPGIGRVEAIERRGRSWVVVTKQGLITSQTW